MPEFSSFETRLNLFQNWFPVEHSLRFALEGSPKYLTYKQLDLHLKESVTHLVNFKSTLIPIKRLL